MAMVSSSTGPINSVLDKLPARPEFSGLRKALGGMKEQMLGFCVPGVVTSRLARRWLLQLREIVYDVDEWLDERLIHSGCRFQWQPWSSSNDLAQIQYFEVQIADAQNRGKTFGVHLELSRMLLRNEIVQYLMDDEQELKVIALLGPGGLGKTTLAREVFKKQQSKFDCAAFVYVGWNPSRNAVLTDIARQVMLNTLLPQDENIVFRLYEFLETKRYLIVIDDVWNVLDWTAISCGLPDNNQGSRIIATSEMKDVANSCCRKPTDTLHLLNPLDDADSRNLVLSRISCLEEDCIPDLKILQNSMFEMFGGNPLVLGIAAGLLAMNSTILSEFEIPENGMPMMKTILDLGYADLPLDMKSCFLYLGVFPKNNIIMKDRLIRRWIAEGFLQISEEESLTEVGESRQIESTILASSAVHLAGVRSLTISGDTNGKLHLSGFKLIRVLDLEDARGLKCNQLRSIGCMLFLRYLGIKGSDVTMLPQKLKALEHLTTLDIRKTSVKYLLEHGTTKLVSLLADHVVISSKMEDMHELEELGTIIVNKKYPLDSLTKLVKSSKLLRNLGVRFDHCDEQGLMHFLAVVEKSNLQTFFVDDHSGLFLDFWADRRLQQLLKLKLRICCERVPSKMVNHKAVTHLNIETKVIEAHDLSILAGLPNLVVLCLTSCHIRGRCMLRNQELEGCFRCLRVFCFKCFHGMMDLNFGPDVMPQLRKLCLAFGVAVSTEYICELSNFEFGIEHLTGLLQVDIHIKCLDPLSSDVEDAKRIIRDQVSLLPNHPLLKLKISHDLKDEETGD
ncbi:hypothetical protein PR202_gb13732 [Eleusine coracana subsp. coracana]|uniref:NB-ARC domain-containing protein n=1 Tax=Eleusine coracana subsp. coracana TaxID=191504 RepID=A0AAV5ESR3_ELECO|nr:hypothetical protein PR202_gb13732 [Eleusine coracana subsp. coracana]